EKGRIDYEESMIALSCRCNQILLQMVYNDTLIRLP
uniref:Uncharacterized protein n=1 Tax=Panagrolaimus sp. ES5 TaxID=591445 RepID=A0AC34GJJ4_9BILA